MVWLLVYHLTFYYGFTWNKELEGIPYDSKEDCMEQLQVIRDNTLASGGKIIELLCKPKKE